MAELQQLRVVRQPSSGIAEHQISAGISDAVQAKSPSLLAWFGIENSPFVRHKLGKTAKPTRSSQTLASDSIVV
jgi:hypothetical protein